MRSPAKLLTPLKFGDHKIFPVVLGLRIVEMMRPVNDGLDDCNDVSR